LGILGQGTRQLHIIRCQPLSHTSNKPCLGRFLAGWFPSVHTPLFPAPEGDHLPKSDLPNGSWRDENPGKHACCVSCLVVTRYNAMIWHKSHCTPPSSRTSRLCLFTETGPVLPSRAFHPRHRLRTPRQLRTWRDVLFIHCPRHWANRDGGAYSR